ncbi:MAG: FHA domain-containing protein [Planctomycetota bacterium]
MPSLQIISGDRRWVRIELDAKACLLGRGGESHLVFEDVWTSREHARIEQEGEVFMVTDLGSENGTFVNDERVETKSLRNGDLLRVGKTEMRFIVPPTELRSAGDDPKVRVGELEVQVRRQRELLTRVRAENERLKHLLAGGEATSRPASGPGINDTRPARPVVNVSSALRYWSLGRQGLRLGQALLDFGAADVEVADQQVRRKSKDARPELDELLQRCLEKPQFDNFLLMTGLKAIKLWVPDPSVLPTRSLETRGATVLFMSPNTDLVAEKPWLEWLQALGLGPLILVEVPKTSDAGFWLELALVVDALHRAEKNGLGFLAAGRARGHLVTMGTSTAPEIRPDFVDGILARAADSGLLFPGFEGRSPSHATLLIGGRFAGHEHAAFRRVFAAAFETLEIETTEDFVLADDGSGLRALVTVEGPTLESLS